LRLEKVEIWAIGEGRIELWQLEPAREGAKASEWCQLKQIAPDCRKDQTDR